MSLYIAGPDRESNRTQRPKPRKAVASGKCPACGGAKFEDSRYVRGGLQYCSGACLRVANAGGGK